MSSNSSKTPLATTKIEVVDNRLRAKGCPWDCGECRICQMEQERVDDLFDETWEIKVQLRKERRRVADEVERIRVWNLDGALEISPTSTLFIHYDEVDDFDDVPF